MRFSLAIFALTLSWNPIVGAVRKLQKEGNDVKVVRKECLTTKPRDDKFFDKTSKGIEDLRKEVLKYCKNPDVYDDDTYGPIEHWDVSRITDMNSLFSVTFNGASKDCNPDISRWNVSAVTDFARMFYKQKFNKDISCWDVSSGTTFDFMFQEDEAFNVDIGDWDVSKGIKFTGMFLETPFNQDIGDWDMSKSFHLDGMFHSARAFNQDISGWDVSNAFYFSSMFENAESFNQPLKWDLSSGFYFGKMLQNAKTFRQNMDHWLEWIDSDDKDSDGWCDGAVCNLACDVLKSSKKCKYEKDSCAWGKGKIFGECEPKSKYEHDCNFADELSCSADDDHGGLCKFDNDMCRHICDDLEKKSCVKAKNVLDNKKMCKATKVKNPCKKCQPKTTCG